MTVPVNPAQSARIFKKSIEIAGHKTSVSLEGPFWQELRAIAEKRAVPLARLVAEVDRERVTNLSSALRLYVLANLKSSLAEKPL